MPAVSTQIEGSVQGVGEARQQSLTSVESLFQETRVNGTPIGYRQMLEVIFPIQVQNLASVETCTNICNPNAAAVLGPGKKVSGAGRERHISHRTKFCIGPRCFECRN
jgi:hypothetical protein